MQSILSLLLLPTVYILAACLSLLQFSVLYSALSGVTYNWERTPGLDGIAPLARTLVRWLEGVFGPAYKFVPSPTHVFMVAIVVAIVAQRR